MHVISIWIWTHQHAHHLNFLTTNSSLEHHDFNGCFKDYFLFFLFLFVPCHGKCIFIREPIFET